MKALALLALLSAGCQHDCPQPEKIEVPTPPVCEADKANLLEVGKLKDELAAAKNEIAQWKAKVAPAKKGKK